MPRQMSGETWKAGANFNPAEVLTGAVGFVQAPGNDRAEKWGFFKEDESENNKRDMREISRH